MITYQAAKFVWKLIDTLPENQNFKIYFDNYFNFLELQAALLRKGIHSIGTLRNNRQRRALLKTEKQLKREGRGSYDSCFDSQNYIYVVRWFDRMAITLSSTFAAVDPIDV